MLILFSPGLIDLWHPPPCPNRFYIWASDVTHGVATVELTARLTLTFVLTQWKQHNLFIVLLSFICKTFKSVIRCSWQDNESCNECVSNENPRENVSSAEQETFITSLRNDQLAAASISAGTVEVGDESLRELREDAGMQPESLQHFTLFTEPKNRQIKFIEMTFHQQIKRWCLHILPL